MRITRVIAVGAASVLAATLLTGAGGGGCAPEPSAGVGHQGPGGNQIAPPVIHIKIIASWHHAGRRHLNPIDMTFDAPRGQHADAAIDPAQDGTQPFKADLRQGESATLDMHQTEDGFMGCIAWVVDGNGNPTHMGENNSTTVGRFITCTIVNNVNHVD